MTIIKNAKQSVFQAEYNYHSAESSIKKSNIISRIVNNFFVIIFKVFIYPGASFLKYKLIDSNRIEQAKKQLISIGGQSVTMKTPDGDKIDGMYLNAKDFKSSFDKYCTLVEVENEDGTIKQSLIVKPEFCHKEHPNGEKFPAYMKPNPEVISILNTLKRLGMEIYPNKVISNEDKTRGYTIELGHVSKETALIEMGKTRDSKPTVIISPGSGMVYPAYKGLAVAYLLRGINVMMFDFRGYGNSQGSPTEIRTKLDLETAYQYVQTQHRVKNEDLIVHGHCLGGGPASDLAARRVGVNLILDRSFSQFREIASLRFPLFKKLIAAIMPSIVNYNNAENLRNVRGHIAIALAADDAVIPEEQITKLIDHLPESRPGKILKLMDTKGGHTGLWTDHDVTSKQFNQFLERTHLKRRLF